MQLPVCGNCNKWRFAASCLTFMPQRGITLTAREDRPSERCHLPRGPIRQSRVWRLGGISAYESLSRLLFGAFMPSVNLRLSKELCVIYGGPDREFTPKSGPFRENAMTPGNRKMAGPKNFSLNQSQRFTKTGNSAFEFFGRHLLANYNRCRPAALADNAGLSAAMEAAIKAAGATLLGRADYSFSPHGMTAVLLLSESHASIHTYPEHGACFVDLFTCGHSCSAEKFDDVMCDYLRPAEVQRRFVLRHSDGIDESSLPNLDAWRHKRAA